MLKKFARFVLLPIVSLFVLISAFGDGPMFRGGVIFSGSSLAGWKPLGAATWKAQNGVITGTPKDASGGWLLIDHALQNAAVYANIRCTGACKTGVLLRAEKTPDGGMKGIYVSFNSDDLKTYAMQIDAQGKETHREELATSANLEQSLAGPGAAFIMGSAGRGPAPAIGANAARPAPPPQPSTPIPASLANRNRPMQPGEWNDLNVVLYGDKVNLRINSVTNREAPGGTAPVEDGAFGPIALYVGGTGQAEFKDVRYTDLNVMTAAKDEVSKNFRMQRLNQLYYSWGATVADVNHDGIPDVIAGAYYYLGPDYTEAHEIFPPSPYNPAIDYADNSMIDLAYDFTGDGWPDVLVMSGNSGHGIGTLYVNPKGESRHWEHHVVLSSVGNEETLLKDVDGDGKPEVIIGYKNQVCYAKPDPANPTGDWVVTPMTEPGPWGNGHGMGIGDVNGDGRMDLVNVYGWWEQPAKGSAQKYWTYHPQAFGTTGAAEIGIYDVNGDGLNDIVTGLEAHGFGLAWYEQKRDAGGNISFVQHMIMDNFLTKNAGDVTFTELHGMTFADMDGDGIPDIITGKRAFSHLFTFLDPDPLGSAVLYWYRTIRDPKAPGGARFVPEMIHNNSGVGSHFAVADLNGDGKPDVVTSGIYGTFVFFNELKKPAAGMKQSGH